MTNAVNEFRAWREKSAQVDSSKDRGGKAERTKSRGRMDEAQTLKFIPLLLQLRVSMTVRKEDIIKPVVPVFTVKLKHTQSAVT